MTGPDGSSSAGYWQWTAVDPQRSFEVRDGFAGEDGEPKTEMPSMSMVFEFAETALGSRLTTTTSFDSLEQLEELKSMGMVEGTTAAMGQIDAVLEDLATFAHELPTASQLVADTQVRVSRVVRGSVEQVWQAHTDPDLLRRWQLGPDGWSMPVCEYSAEVGSALRTEWRDDASGEQFGFVGTVLESQPPTRLVTTERMISPADPEGADSPETTNELTLTAVSGGTLVVYHHHLPERRSARDGAADRHGRWHGRRVRPSRERGSLVATQKFRAERALTWIIHARARSAGLFCAADRSVLFEGFDPTVVHAVL